MSKETRGFPSNIPLPIKRAIITEVYNIIVIKNIAFVLKKNGSKLIF